MEKSIKTKCEYCDKPTDEQHYEGEYCCASCYNEFERENAYSILADIGVPFSSDGEPLGIWSD